MKWMCNLDVTESCNSKSFDLLLPIFNAKIAQSLQSSRRFKVRIILLRWTTTVEFYSLTDFNWPCCLIELTPLTKFYNTSYGIPLHESNKFGNETSELSIFANFTILYSIWESEKFVDINLFKKKKKEIEIPFLNTRSISLIELISILNWDRYFLIYEAIDLPLSSSVPNKT